RSLDEAHHHVDALAFQLVCILEHLVALANPCGGANVHTESRAAFRLGAGEQRFRIGHGFFGNCASSARFRSRTLTTGSPRNPNCRPSVCAWTRRSTSATPTPRSRATRGT